MRPEDEMSAERPRFASLAEYSEHFTDTAYWQPYVETICSRHGLAPCRHIRSGLGGTHPVFIVDDRYVVKLFTDLFNGAHGFAVESDLYPLLAATPQIPVPSLLAQAHLFPEGGGWPWPYLVSTVLPGMSMGEVRDRITLADKTTIAAYLGPIVRHIHALPIEGAPSLPRSWDAFVHLLQRRRDTSAADYARGGIMPRRLADQIDSYLPSVDSLIDRTMEPQLLHCDLNQDHVLGRFNSGHWQLTGIIDFGDAQVGDPLYELVALHLGLFHCDKQLLRTFLDAYGSNIWAQEHIVFRAMCVTLLHEFTVLDQVFANFPSAREVGSLVELATLVWDLESPGLGGSGRSPSSIT
jgi:hygromycin-B 7''-O-kinase